MRRNIKIIFSTVLIVVCLFFLYNLILLGEIVEDQPETTAQLKKHSPSDSTHTVDHYDEYTNEDTRFDQQPDETRREHESYHEPEKNVFSGNLVNLVKFNSSIMILTHKRQDYLVQVLDSLSKLPQLSKLTNIIISQDGNDGNVRSEIEKYQKKSIIPIIHQVHQQEDKRPIFAIAKHYGWALEQAFEKHNSEFVIILEDDIIPSPDFLEYFDQLAPYLLDPSEKVWCVSSWNDLGFKHLDLDRTKVYRTQFFPGLGWMMHRKVWMEEFRYTWPNQAWDYFMRTSHIHRHRDCICPELPRNTNIGVSGATVKGAGTFDRLLSQIDLQSSNDLIELDLSHISLPKYDDYIRALIKNGKILPLNTKMSASVISSNPGDNVFVIPFEYRSGLESIIRSLGITYHNEERTHHEHVIIVPYKSNKKVVLVNAKLSKFVPDSHRISPPETFKIIPAERPNESCDVVCQRDQKKCSQYNFDYIMNCDTIKEFFPCEKGCQIEIGKEIPSYVVGKSDMNYKKCVLLTQDNPQCGAVHRNTQRLCPCH